MALETKIIIKLLAEAIGRAKSVEEAYTILADTADVEGITLPSYEEFTAKIASKERKTTGI